MDRNYDIIKFISKCIYLKKSRVAIFADIIKIVTIIKTVSSFIIVGYVCQILGSSTKKAHTE